MKESNLISILSAFKNLSSVIFESYLEYHNVKIKTEELKDLEVLVNHFRSLSTDIKIFDKYFIGYLIPQIGKEFDLLRMDDETLINIELKKESTSEKIYKQLIKNKYYLSFLNKKMFLFTYVANEEKLYKIDDNGHLLEVDITELIVLLTAQNIKKIKDIDSYFVPSNYLVSPFNTTEQFIKEKYFLTVRQDDIKNTILKELQSTNYSLLSIKGSAGTGKTLLTYDIAKTVIKQKDVLIIHCGYLNNGHIILSDDYNWNIIPAKEIFSQDYSKYYLIIIDEAQRIYVNQLHHIIEQIKKYSNNCIFSYDGQQTLRQKEINNNIEAQIEQEITSKPFALTNKIRTNKEVAAFIKCLFNKKRIIEKFKYSNIELSYFDDYYTVVEHLKQIRNEGWKVINYTPCKSVLTYDNYAIHDEYDNAHKVIGQEFDNVVAVIDAHFYYNNGELSTKNHRNTPYYHPTKMLLQIVSRTRIKLHIIVINNHEVLNRCLDVLKQ